jgi:hypothetical protein
MDRRGKVADKKTEERSGDWNNVIGKGQNLTRPLRRQSFEPSGGFLFWFLHCSLIQKPQVKMEIISAIHGFFSE